MGTVGDLFVGNSDLAQCKLANGCTRAIFIVPDVTVNPFVEPAGTKWTSADWNKWCSGATPQGCPNGHSISNIQHSVCKQAEGDWRCLDNINDFKNTFPVPTPPLWGPPIPWPWP